MYEKLCHLNDDQFGECTFVVAPGSLLLLSPIVLGKSSQFASEWRPLVLLMFVAFPRIHATWRSPTGKNRTSKGRETEVAREHHHIVKWGDQGTWLEQQPSRNWQCTLFVRLILF